MELWQLRHLRQLFSTDVTMKLTIPIELANQILGYLGSRPYQEVYQLVQAIQEAAKPKDVEIVEQAEND